MRTAGRGMNRDGPRSSPRADLLCAFQVCGVRGAGHGDGRAQPDHPDPAVPAGLVLALDRLLLCDGKLSGSSVLPRRAAPGKGAPCSPNAALSAPRLRRPGPLLPVQCRPQGLACSTGDSMAAALPPVPSSLLLTRVQLPGD